MVNSVLDVMPAYMMSVFPAPDNVIKRIDMLRRNFFWQRNEDEKNSFGQMGRGYKKQEERGSRDQNYKDAKQKPNDDVLWKFVT
uniref:Putative ovule protein n=1 Tax=Solanum chacoense TaxID=4108 RepID=A0A0V0H8K9_SOLCH